VRRYLVVANQTLGGDELVAQIRERARAGESTFRVLVPATALDQLDPAYVASAAEAVKAAGPAPSEDPDRVRARQLLEDEVEDPRPGELRGEDLARRLARQRLKHELERLRELGIDASGEVGPADPVEAVSTVLHRHEFDEIILSTLPGRRSRWLAANLPARIRRATRIPVTQVVGSGMPRPPGGTDRG
jgi:hypothetical protein